MHSIWRFSLSLALAALVASPALAQPQRQRPQFPGGFGGPGAVGGGAMLLANPSVQEELNLTDDQKEKIQEVGQQARERIRESFRDQDRERIREITEEITKEMTGVLDENQLKRFKQIQLQQQGVRAFTTDEVQEALSLSEEQQSKIGEIVEEHSRRVREELRGTGPEGFQQAREARQRLNQETMTNIVRELTPEQRRTWQELQGEPFEIRFERPTRPGGGEGRPIRPGARGGAPRDI